MLAMDDTTLDETNLNETSEMFEQDSFALENKIVKLEDTISKSMNEVARIFEMKYRDFLPHLISITDCQDKIQSALKSGNIKLKRLQTALSTAEKNVAVAADEAPTKKLSVVRGFITRLGVLSEIEQCFSELWMGAQNGDKERDILADVNVILKLEVFIQELELEASTGAETVNERILPLIFAEYSARRSEILNLLEDFYALFVQFRATDQNPAGLMEMVLKCDNAKNISANLSAMHKLGQLQKHLDAFADGVWNVFCQRIVHSSVPGQVVQYRSKDFDGFVTFSARRDIAESTCPDPYAVFQALEKFLGILRDSLALIKVDGVPLLMLFGDAIVPRLIGALTKDCLVPFIPYEEKNDDLYEKLADLCKKFCDFLLANQLSSSDELKFEYFLENYDRIFVDRRCHHYISLARDLVIKQYIDLIEVGCSTDEEEENVGDVLRMMDEKMKLDEKAVIDMLKSPKADKFSTKLFQLQKCSISKSTFELVQLFQDCIVAAMEAKTELETCRLFITARNMIETFVQLAPLHHQQALSTVPQIAAVFFNNCHYICNRLVTVQTDMTKRANVTHDMISEFNFSYFFGELRLMSSNILEQHLVQIRRQISAAIGNADIFIGIHEDTTLRKCERSLNACTMHVGQVASVWREVMPELILTHSLGALVSHLLTVVTNIVLTKEDISVKDSVVLVKILQTLVQKLKSMLTINGTEVIHRVCEKPYYRITEVIFCLDANLMDIDHRWCEGKGPLSQWLKSTEVRKLVRALFQNTDHRAQLLSRIN